MKSRYAFLFFLIILIFIACSNRNSPQAVTEDFIYNYYKLANQAAALQLSAELATEKLNDEIARLHEVRSPTDPIPEMPNIAYKQIGKETTTEIEDVMHVSFNYELTIKNRNDETTHTRNVVITTENIDGQWKVINFGEY